MLWIVAIITMFADHIGKYCLNDAYQLRLVGRLCMPMIAVLAASGLILTKSHLDYGMRLILVGLVAQIPMMMLGSFSLSFLVGLGCGVILMGQAMKGTTKGAVPLIVAIGLSQYGLWTLLIISVTYKCMLIHGPIIDWPRVPRLIKYSIYPANYAGILLYKTIFP